MRFDQIIVVDWSANSSPKRGADSIWIGSAGAFATPPCNLPTRHGAMALLRDRLAQARGQRVLVAFDIGFGFPQGFARTLTGRPEALAVWDWFAARLQDDAQNRNNRFEVAAQANQLFPGVGPFWGCPTGQSWPDLPAKGRARHGHGLAELRQTERLCAGAHPMWKLYTTGAVGSQSLLGMLHLARLRHDLGAQAAVWPMQPATAPIVLAETYLSLIDPVVRHASGYACKDAAQCDLLAQALWRCDLTQMMAPPAPPPILTEEGWILGAGHDAELCKLLT